MDYLKERAIIIRKNEVYFFNSEGIYTKTSVEKAYKKHLNGLKRDYYKLGEYCSDMDFSGATARAILCLEVGDTIEKLQKDIKRFEVIEKKEEKGCINQVFRKAKHDFYFFNEMEEWTCLSEKEILPTNIAIPYIWFERGKDIKYLPVNISYSLLQQLDIDNKVLLRKALCILQPGDTIEILKKYCREVTLNENLKTNREEKGIVSKIGEPIFICKPENLKKITTFDYIHVDVSLLTTWRGDKKEYIIEHKKEISRMVLEKIKKNRNFIKYNVPINCLKIVSIILYKDRNMLQYILELKTIK